MRADPTVPLADRRHARPSPALPGGGRSFFGYVSSMGEHIHHHHDAQARTARQRVIDELVRATREDGLRWSRNEDGYWEAWHAGRRFSYRRATSSRWPKLRAQTAEGFMVGWSLGRHCDLDGLIGKQANEHWQEIASELAAPTQLEAAS
jgi:hypothetical protein